MKSRTLAAAITVAVMAAPIGGQSVVLRGKVVDDRGRPVKDVEVATMWVSFKGKMSAFEGTRTNAAGTWSLATETYGKPVAVLAIDAAQVRGALAVFAPKGDPSVTDLRLGPLQQVKGSVTCSDLAAPVAWSNTYVNAMPAGARFVQCSSTRGMFSFLLPRGDYQFDVYGTDTENKVFDRTIAGEPVDVGAVDLPATVVARLYGKEPPLLKTTEARGVPDGFNLASAKGKFVILEFWGFW